MRPLLIDDAAKARIAAVKDYADKFRYSKPFMLERMRGGGTVPGDTDKFTCFLQFGFKCVYTIEEQPDPIGWAHHLSVSVDDPERVPSIPAVEMLMKEFGITTALKECHVWMEDNIRPRAVNILAKM